MLAVKIASHKEILHFLNHALFTQEQFFPKKFQGENKPTALLVRRRWEVGAMKNRADSLVEKKKILHLIRLMFFPQQVQLLSLSPTLLYLLFCSLCTSSIFINNWIDFIQYFYILQHCHEVYWLLKLLWTVIWSEIPAKLTQIEWLGESA